MEDGGTQQHAPVTDDQELAKVLASMSEEAKKQGPEPTTPSSETVPTPAVIPEPVATNDTPATDSSAPVASDTQAATDTSAADITLPELPPVPTTSTPLVPSDLDEIKKSALSELRPIVDKLDLPAEEKFEALLLVIRSSDDQSLIKAAYNAAEGITDEAKKAQALLDVVKEIEYFSSRSA